MSDDTSLNPYGAEFAIQRDNSTYLNRYPEVFSLVKKLWESKKPAKPRILSFGCSRGDEPYTLGHDYFPNSDIVALDISDEALEVAMRDRSIPGVITYAKSTPETLKKHGPYDIIFAMSVLCRWPDLHGSENSNRLFPFYQYDALVRSLHQVLSVGGILAIYNSNYAFSDADLINCYSIVLDQILKTNGFVKHFDTSGRAIPDYSGTETIYLKDRESSDLVDSANLNFIGADGVALGTVRGTRFRTLI